MDITSYLLGKNSGGGGDVTLQNNKAVTITSNGSTVVNPDEGYDGLKKATITTNVQPNLETQTVTISTNTTTTITPTQGKDGLSSVSVITNVPTPGVPTKGIILSDWDNDGYPGTLEIVGLTQIPNYYFHMNNDSGTTDGIFKKANIILPNSVTSIGWYAFSYMGLSQITFSNTLTIIKPQAFANCKNLASITLPNSLTTLGQGAFHTCTKLVITKIPAQTIDNQAFYSCSSIKKLCMPNIQTVSGDSQGNSSFRYCTGLKQVWIGSNITTNGLQRYAFSGDNSLEKIYINLPRATVEAMTGYSYAFMDNASKTGIIVCNDDTGFITEQEFDALVVN